MSIEFALSLRDQMSGAAHKMAAEIRSVSAALHAVQKEARSNEIAGMRDPHKKAIAMLSDRKKEILAAQKDMSEAGGGKGGGLGGIMGELGVGGGFAGPAAFLAMVGGILAGLTAIGVKLWSVGAAAGNFILQQQGVREATLGSFSTLLGGADKASEAFKTATGFAVRFGFTTEEAFGGFRALMAQGMDIKRTESVMQSLAGLKAINPKVDIGNAISAISQIQSKGKLGLEELQGQLADSAGLSVGAVQDELAAMLKVSGATQKARREAVSAMISAGKIDSETGIKAIQAAINKMAGGDAVKAAEEAASTIPALMKRFSDLPNLLVQSMDMGPAIAPVKQFMKNILEVLDPTNNPATKALVGSFGALFGAVTGHMGDMAGGLTGKAGIQMVVQGLADGINMVASAIKTISPMVTAFFHGMKDGAGAAIGPAVEGFKTFFETLGGGDKTAGIKMLAEAMGVLGKGIGFLVGMFAAVAISGVTALGALLSIVDAISSMIGVVQSSGDMIGAMLVDGIIAGITNGTVGVVSAILGLAATIVGTATSALQIRSPSKVMARLGGHVAGGFAQGIDAGTDSVVQAVGGMAAAPTAAPGAMAAAGGGGGGMSMGSIEIHVHVDGGSTDSKAGAQKVAEEVRSILPGVLRDAFDQISIEMGLSPA